MTQREPEKRRRSAGRRPNFKIFMDEHYGPGKRGERGEYWRFFAVEQKAPGIPHREEVLIRTDIELRASHIMSEVRGALVRSKTPHDNVWLSRIVHKLFGSTPEQDCQEMDG